MNILRRFGKGAAALVRRVVPARFRPYVYLVNSVRKSCDGCVRSGPFQGMRYVGESVGSMYVPKLLGIYEREIHEVVNTILARSPGTLIDIGAAEGYYAVGFAWRLPHTRVIAYEAGELGRGLIAEMASLNGVTDNLDIRGLCSPDDIGSCDSDTVIFCDCDGGEDDLFDDAAAARLSRACILIESHDVIRKGVTVRLKDRFAATHHCQEMVAEDRRLAEFPFHGLRFRILPQSYREWAVNESRWDGRTWLWFTPRAGSEGVT